MPPSLVYEIEGRRIVHRLEGDEVTIGRSSKNDVVLDDPTISRKHARLWRAPDGWHVADLGSTYGTRVNDRDGSDAPLTHGDTILLHRFPLTFAEHELDEVAATTAPGATLAPLGAGESGHTVFHDTVDFAALAAGSADVRHLQRLLDIAARASEVVLVSRSPDEVFEKVLDLVFLHLPVERGFVMLWDDERRDLVARCVRDRSDRAQAATGAGIRFSRTIAEKVVRDKKAVLTSDALADGRFAAGESVVALGIRAAMAAPVWRGEHVDGLIYADTASRAKAFDRFDLDLLSALGNQLAAAIEQFRLRASVLEQEVARRRLERYHSPAVVARIAAAAESGEDALVAEEREVTVLFADVVQFTRRCEGLEPRAVAELLNRYFREMAEVIFRHEGTLDKFIGDCVMAVFGAPLPAGDHARRAVRAALEMREALAELNQRLPAGEQLEFRVALHSGRVIAGDIGSPRRSDYTVLGTTVNVASRIESSVAEPGQIVVSEPTRRALGDGFALRSLGLRRLEGISRPIDCHEVLGEA